MPEGFCVRRAGGSCGCRPCSSSCRSARGSGSGATTGMVARLRPGVPIETSARRACRDLESLARDFPKSNAGWTVTVESLHARSSATSAARPGCCSASVGGGADRHLSQRRRPADRARGRTAARDGGACRARRRARGGCCRLSICEAAVIAGCGGAPGSCWPGRASPALRAAAPPGIPRVDAIHIDAAALAVTALATLFSVFVFAAAPSRMRRGATSATRLRSSPGHGGRHPCRVARWRSRSARARPRWSFSRCCSREASSELMTVDLGWRAERVLSMSVSPKMPSELRRPVVPLRAVVRRADCASRGDAGHRGAPPSRHRCR